MPDHDRAERRAFVSSVTKLRISEMAGIFLTKFLRTLLHCGLINFFICTHARTHSHKQTYFHKHSIKRNTASRLSLLRLLYLLSPIPLTGHVRYSVYTDVD